jgi:hypothetical protein
MTPPNFAIGISVLINIWLLSEFLLVYTYGRDISTFRRPAKEGFVHGKSISTNTR